MALDLLPDLFARRFSCFSFIRFRFLRASELVVQLSMVNFWSHDNILTD